MFARIARSVRHFTACGLFACSLLAAAADEAPKEITRGGHHAGHFYLLVDEAHDLSWQGARDRCLAWGGDLAVLTDEAEAKFITALCDGRYAYLGASDATEEGTWVWVDGSAWEFTHWSRGQPNNYGGSEDYLATYDDGEWVDVDASGGDFWMPTGFICEWSEKPELWESWQ